MRSPHPSVLERGVDVSTPTVEGDSFARIIDADGIPLGDRPTVRISSPLTPASSEDRGRFLQCRICKRSEPRSAGDLRRLARGAWPMCCGQVMPPAAEPAASSETPAEELPWADRRVANRYLARAGCRVEVRRGMLGMSPNLAVSLIDVSISGVQVQLSSAIRPGERAEVALWPPGEPQSIRGPAVVCWALPLASGEFRAGMRLQRRLSDEAVGVIGE